MPRKYAVFLLLHLEETHTEVLQVLSSEIIRLLFSMYFNIQVKFAFAGKVIWYVHMYQNCCRYSKTNFSWKMRFQQFIYWEFFLREIDMWYRFLNPQHFHFCPRLFANFSLIDHTWEVKIHNKILKQPYCCGLQMHVFFLFLENLQIYLHIPVDLQHNFSAANPVCLNLSIQ